MKRLSIITLLLFTAISFFGCTQEGNLDVTNSSNGWVDVTVDQDLTRLDADESVTYTWDFLADASKDVPVTADGLYVIGFESTGFVAGGQDDQVEVWGNAAALTITNNGSYSVNEIYISEYTNDTWGTEWLGSDVLAPGASVVFTVEPNAYDVKVVDTNGNIYVKSWLDWVYLDRDTMYELTVGGKGGLKKGVADMKRQGGDPGKSDAAHLRIIRR